MADERWYATLLTLADGHVTDIDRVTTSSEADLVFSDGQLEELGELLWQVAQTEPASHAERVTASMLAAELDSRLRALGVQIESAEGAGTSGASVWLIRAGGKGEDEDLCLSSGVCGIGWPELSDLSGMEQAQINAEAYLFKFFTALGFPNTIFADNPF